MKELNQLKTEYEYCRLVKWAVVGKDDMAKVTVTVEVSADPGTEQDCDQIAWSGRTLAVPYRLDGDERERVGSGLPTKRKGYMSTVDSSMKTVVIQAEQPDMKINITTKDRAAIARKAVTKPGLTAEQRTEYRAKMEIELYARVRAARDEVHAALERVWDAESWDVVPGAVQAGPTTGILPGLEG
jgi:hypothetical protein